MTTETLAEPTRSPTAVPMRWAPLVVVLIGTFMTFLDFFIVNVGLPSIGRELHAGPSAVQLVVAGYGLAFAVGMISGGRLGDRYGRRAVFGLGLALFTLTSALCGLAPDPTVLVAARVGQGVAGSLLTPQVLAILSAVYAGPQRARAFAAYGFAMGIAGVLGQLLGGALISADLAGSGWRAIFLINVPVGAAALGALRYVPESRGTRERLDLIGSVLVTLALVAVVAPLVEGRADGWPLWTVLSFAAAPVLFAVFALHQLRRRAAGRPPLVDLGLFGLAGFRIGSLAAMAFGLVPAAFFFVLALYLQQGRGLSPVLSGVVFTAVGGGYFLAMLLAGPAAARLGRQVLALGAVLVAAGCGLLAATADAGSAWTITPGLALVGFGIGFVLVPLSATVLADVPVLRSAAAAGVLATAQQVGGALGVAVIGVVFYGHLGSGVGAAFRVCLLVLAGLTGLTAALVQALPSRPRRPDSAARPARGGCRSPRSAGRA